MKYFYDDSERSTFLQNQVRWADGILADENVIYPSGKWSHECALEVRDSALDELLNHVCTQLA